jgi:hypothetical protein
MTYALRTLRFQARFVKESDNHANAYFKIRLLRHSFYCTSSLIRRPRVIVKFSCASFRIRLDGLREPGVRAIGADHNSGAFGHHAASI